jgi:hypothetical protein
MSTSGRVARPLPAAIFMSSGFGLFRRAATLPLIGSLIPTTIAGHILVATGGSARKARRSDASVQRGRTLASGTR